MLKIFSKIEEKIRRDRCFIFTAFSLLSAVFLFFNMSRWHSLLVGAVLLSAYFIINGFWLEKILNYFLPLGKWCRFLFGVFFLVYLLAFGGAIFVTFYKITPFFIFLVFLVLTLIISFLSNRTMFGDPTAKHLNPYATKDLPQPLPPPLAGQVSGRGADAPFSSPDKGRRGGVEPSAEEFSTFDDEKKIKIPKFCCVLYVMCYVLCVFLLFRGRTGQFILSPWEVIPPLYLDVFLLLTFLTALIIFSKQRVKIILMVIILHSLLLRAYLPIVYEPGFGGDKWRHIGAEKYLDEGKVYSPALFGVAKEQMEWSRFGPLKIPAVFVVGNKTSYANMWALTIILSRSLNIDVFWIDFFLVFLLWSVFMPLFLFRMAKIIYPNKTFILLAAFLPSLFYPFQVYGAITLPVSFGFLFFVFCLIFWLRYLQTEKKEKFFLILFAVFGLMMYLNYVVYFILFLEIAALIWLIKKTNSKQKSEKQVSPVRRRLFVMCYALCVMCCVFLLPLLDAFYKLSAFKPDIFNLKGFLSAGREFLTKIIALQPFVPGTGYVSQGDFLFRQVGESLSEAAVFFLLPWWPAATSVLIWLGVIYGLVKFKKEERKNGALAILSLLFVIVLGNHFISWHLMDGIRLLCKRLDLTLAFLISLFLALGIAVFFRQKISPMTSKAKILIICLFLTLAVGFTYASGPKMQTVTNEELKAAEYVWNQLKVPNSIVALGQELPNAQRLTPNARYCVLANTWPLLALEAVSGREITTGGFPAYVEYAQPERVQLFEKMSAAPSIIYMEKALEITQSPSCYFMTEKKWMNKQDPEHLKKLIKIFGGYVKIGEVYIFKYQSSL